VARLGFFDLLLRRFQLGAQRLQLGARLLGPLDPGLHAAWLGRLRAKAWYIQRRQRLYWLPGEHLQPAAGEVHVLQRLQLLRKRQVQAGPRLVHIGACARTGGQTPACRFQLHAIGLLLCSGEQQLVLRQQRIKIRFTHPHHQRLLVALQARIRFFCLRLSLEHQRIQKRSVQRLAQRQHLVAAVVPVLRLRGPPQKVPAFALQIVVVARG
jgi:hypothetical protein